MIRCFKRLAAAPRSRCPCQQVFVQLKIPLEIERFAHAPALLPRQRRQKPLSKQGCLAPVHGPRLGAALFPRLIANDFKSSHAQLQKSLSLQQRQQVAIHHGMDLQRLTAILDDIRIHKARHDALPQKRFVELLCNLRWCTLF
ncbi:MAG: hypothetical protein DMG37_11770 [Acidobacteria bacterium]|nr:MAG: hypothetical protein DMG37_11770 [Acidobacteriota bacterium]